ncbi:MAG TPA: SGNH/GDSL hydrolase family protein [Candidatus Acidoferrales bacterium]|nr:SGNH/GDSL hydrolase family protein [Candidatus Acidoferrales bacterium]
MDAAFRAIKNQGRFAIFFVIFALLPGFAAAQRQTSAKHWVGTWAASPQMPEGGNGIPESDEGFNNQTVRMIARVSIGGKQVRVRLSNEYGTAPVEIGDAHIALAGKGAEIVAGTDRQLTFSGEKTFVIPPGAEVMSDPVRLDIKPLTAVAVSIFVPNATGPATWHALARQTTYISSAGNFTATTNMAAARTMHSWYWLSGIEVLASARTAAVVTLGDSITDGAASTLDANHRWPDVLADEFAKNGAALSVLNEGISGNRLLHDVAGMNALARFDADVLSQDGVKYLIVLEGINDIGWPHILGGKYAGDAVSAEEIIAALRQIAERAHAHGIRVFGATLTPFEGAFYETADGEAEREAVNHWIRTSGAFDGVIDFDKVTRDPAQPKRFLPADDSGDHLHPGDAGYKAMGHAAAEALLQGMPAKK